MESSSSSSVAKKLLNIPFSYKNDAMDKNKMTSEMNSNVNEEIKYKKSEDSLNKEGLDSVNFDINAELPDFNTKSRKIRCILNKVSEENIEKLAADLVTGFEYNTKLLKELARLIFERTTARKISEFYPKLCAYFYNRLKLHNREAYKVFKKCLNERCETLLTIVDQSIVPLSNFVALLFKQNLIKSSVIYQFFDLITKEITSEHQLEAVCVLLKIASPYLVSIEGLKLEKMMTFITNFQFQLYPKRIQFLIMEIVETKSLLLTPALVTHSHTNTPFKDTKHSVRTQGKGVSFSTNDGFEPVQSRQSKRILKQRVSEEVKSELRGAVSEFIGGKTSLETCKEIFKANQNKERQLINQIFKYALSEYNREAEFAKICEMVIRISDEINNKEVIETGLTYTVEAIHDIKLDSPMAPQHLIFVINKLHESGAIESTNYLFNHFAN